MGVATKFQGFCFLAILIGVSPSCGFAQDLSQVDQCLGAYDQTIKHSLENHPVFKDIKDAVRWVNQHMPEAIEAELQKAGEAVLAEEQGKLSVTSDEEKQSLQKLLYKNAALELYKTKPYADTPYCTLVLPDKTSNDIGMILNLSYGSLQKEFNALGLSDSYDIEHAFFIMLVVDASGEQWRTNWFTK